MRHLMLAFLAFTLLPLAASAAPRDAVILTPEAAPRMTMTMERRPLMVVRFNQRNVHYERQLYGALEQAVAVKPDVLFDLVAVVPEAPSDLAAQELREAASRGGQRVTNSMMRMGVPQSRISYREVSDPMVRYPEVRIFVR